MRENPTSGKARHGVAGMKRSTICGIELQMVQGLINSHPTNDMIKHMVSTWSSTCKLPAMNIFSPDFGLRPSRAARSFESNVPKPTKETLVPFATDSTMTSRALQSDAPTSELQANLQRQTQDKRSAWRRTCSKDCRGHLFVHACPGCDCVYHGTSSPLVTAICMGLSTIRRRLCICTCL